MNPNTKKFKDLQDKWYQKIKNKGFVDIEDKDGRIDKDKALHNIATHYDQNSFYIKEEYYRIAGQFLHEHKFKDNFEKIIWESHSSGISIVKIVRLLKRKGYKSYKNKVHQVIQALVEEMKAHVRKK